MTRAIDIAYDVRGDGEPVLFIQGVGLHGDGWLPQVEALSKQYRCVSFDNRGMGRSQAAAQKITVDQMAADAIAVMDHAGIESAHVVGHSLGGSVALAIALGSRRRVRSLALLCTSARGADATRFAMEIVWPGMRSRIGTRRMRRHAFLEIVMPKDLLQSEDRDGLAEKLALYFGHDLADSPPVVDHQLAALKAFDATSRLHELAGLPALVVSAQHDVIFPPRFGRALADGIPRARFVEIQGAAHGVTIQRADRVNALLTSFFGAADPQSGI